MNRTSAPGPEPENHGPAPVGKPVDPGAPAAPSPSQGPSAIPAEARLEAAQAAPAAEIVGQPHYTRTLHDTTTAILHRLASEQAGLHAWRVPHVLAWGPRGCGKSAGLRAAASASGIPLLRVDIVEGLCRETPDFPGLLQESLRRDPDFVARCLTLGAGMVALEGFDHLGSGPGRLLQPGVCLAVAGALRVPLGQGPTTIAIDCSRLTFVALGAFDGGGSLGAGLGAIAARRGPVEEFGFVAGGRTQPTPSSVPHPGADVADLIEFGFLPELACLFPVVVGLNRLTPEDMLLLLSRSGGPVDRLREACGRSGLELCLPAPVLERIALNASAGPLQARALEGLFARIAAVIAGEDARGGDGIRGVTIADPGLDSSPPVVVAIPGCRGPRARKDPPPPGPPATPARDPVDVRRDHPVPSRPTRHASSPASQRLANAADLRAIFCPSKPRRPGRVVTPSSSIHAPTAETIPPPRT